MRLADWTDGRDASCGRGKEKNRLTAARPPAAAGPSRVSRIPTVQSPVGVLADVPAFPRASAAITRSQPWFASEPNKFFTATHKATPKERSRYFFITFLLFLSKVLEFPLEFAREFYKVLSFTF